MKFIKILLISLFILILFSCIAPGSNSNSGTTDNGDGSVSQSLTFSVDDIATISPYSYSNSASRNGVIAKSFDAYSYLSYTTPSSVNPEPIVFITDSGTKVVFKGVRIKDVGNGIIFCALNQLETIKKEPQVIYKETGEKDENENPILEPTTIYVDVINSFGDNLAFINTKTGDVYLLNDPYGNHRIYMNVYDDYYWENAVMASPNNVYLQVQSENGYTLLRVNKSTFKVDTLTNDEFLKYPWFEAVSDDSIFFYEESSGFFTLDIKNQSTPMLFDNQKFNINVKFDEFNDYMFQPSTNSAFFVGNKFHMLSNANGNSFLDLSFSLIDGEAVLDGYEIINTPLSTSTFWDVSVVNIIDNGNDVKVILYVSSPDKVSDTAHLMQLSYKGNNKPDIKSITISGNSSSNRSFEYQNGKVYWIDGATTSNSKICVANLDTGYYHERKMNGKTIASSNLRVNKNGTITYWQYMGITQVATFTVNPETNDEPKLLLVSDVDVHQVININTL